MTLLTKEDIRTLLEKSKGPCVSIFMPIHHAGVEVQQNPIRLKNLQRKAKGQLNKLGLSSQEEQVILTPISDLQKDDPFWRCQSDGLAVFSSRETFRAHRLPLSFEELVVVSRRFHIKPLLPLLTCDGQYYVLALTQKGAKLIQSTRYSVSEVELDINQGLEQTVQKKDRQQHLQFHTPTPVGRGEQAAMFHGQGSGVDDAEADLLRYFRQIDQEISNILKRKRAPLVLAGVDYLLPLYKTANTYQHIMDEGIIGNPEGLRPEELRDRAWPIVEPYFLWKQQEESARFNDYVGTGRASNKLQEVVSAAYYGKVETMFTAVGVQLWGRFHPDSNRVRTHSQARPGDEDLLNFAAGCALLNGGTVYAMASQDMPGGKPLAAIFRY
ncbi:MAG: hypothetical protein SXV54_22105 [Chloroflexota bacterium]|nr:hypothetical protein [Chloroflexota bacterium]